MKRKYRNGSAKWDEANNKAYFEYPPHHGEMISGAILESLYSEESDEEFKLRMDKLFEEGLTPDEEIIKYKAEREYLVKTHIAQLLMNIGLHHPKSIITHSSSYKFLQEYSNE